MGAKESRSSILSYDDAVKRVTASELQRIQEAYKKACGFSGIMREIIFIRDVLGENVPVKVAQRIFTIMSTHSRGMTFRDLLVTLVVLTRGKREERLKLIYAVYCDDHNSGVTTRSMSNMMFACGKTGLPHEAHSLFKNNDVVSYDQFRSWILTNPDITSVTRWLMNSSGVTLSLTEDMEMPNFYQTLAGVTHLDESDIIELEKRYWQLKSQSTTGKFDLATLKTFVSPPLPEILLEGLFNAFDENQDGHIDFKEISCGVSACCRGPLTERQKFCYKIFDADKDNKLSSSELRDMALGLLEVQKANCSKEIRIIEQNKETTDGIVNNIVSHISRHSSDKNEYVTLEEYQLWSLEDPLPTILLNMVFEICHIVLGLRPSSPQEEGTIVRGWMHRASNSTYKPGETWYVVSAAWWKAWKRYTNYDPILSPNTTARWIHKAEEGDMRTSSSETIGSALEATEVMSHATLHGKPNKHYGKTPGKALRVSSDVVPRSALSPGPINNSVILVEENTKISTLTDEGGRLKENIVMGVDYDLLPEPVWKALHHWYGGSPVLPRIVPLQNPGEKPWLELHRLHIFLLRHQLPSSMQQLSQLAFPGSGTLTGLGNSTLGILKHSINFVAGSNNTPKRHIQYRATFSRRHTVGQVSSFLSQRLRLLLDNMRLWHLLDENNANLLDDEGMKLEDLGIKNNSQILLEVRNIDMSWPEELSQIARNHKQRMKGSTKQVVIVKGTTGLSNLGNTCFMNSSIQCMSNTTPLTLYFLKNLHLYELNRTSPLGLKGHIAKRYGDLIHDIWSGTSKTIAPLKVRWTISKYAPLFNNFAQQDSQELFAFLLDGLHEDLNRVHEKPYRELKDSDGRPDEEVAQEAWENHISRNQSIIVDLFHGQIRSRVRCMKCGSVSVRFDPLTFLSLPLPMDNLMYFEIVVIRLDGKVPTRYGLRLSMDDTFVEVRKHLAEKCNISIDAILLVEVVGATVKNFLQNTLKVRSSAIGNLYAYEIPPPQRVNIFNHTKKSETTPNGGLKHVLTNGNGAQSSNGQVVTKPHIGSSVHETSKRSITNHSSVHIKTASVSTGSTDSSGVSEHKTVDSLTNSPGDRSPPMRNENLTNGSSFHLRNYNDNRRITSTDSLGSSSLRTLERGDTDDVLCGIPDQSVTTYPGYVFAYHRKIFHLDVYFLSSQKHRPSLFGVPLVVPCVPGQPKRQLYKAVWDLVSRLFSPLPPAESSLANHAQDCDDSLATQYPFVLRSVERCGLACGNGCPWFYFCKGCPIPCSDEPWKQTSEYIAIDWDPTALHLRYQPSAEKEVDDDISVEEGHRGQRQRIDLDYCLRVFTSEEELGTKELYYCGKCKTHQVAKKKLDIWRLPPILIVHLKRFQMVNGRWIKSHKVVDFPQTDFDPSHFMSGRDDPDDSADVGEVDTSDALFQDIAEDQETIKSEKIVKNPHHISFVDDVEVEDVGDDAEVEDTSIQSSPQTDSVPKKIASEVKSSPQAGGGPARRRQPSFRENSPPLFNLFAVSCHSGIMGGGHYIAYAKNRETGKWYCYNDSSCKEVAAENISVETAYMLFYERQDLNYDDFMPSVVGKHPVNTDSMDDDYNSEFKKLCVIQ